MSNIKKAIIKVQLGLYIWLIKHLCSVRPGTIVFQSKPDYSDNSKAIADYLVANGYADKYKIHYLVSEKFGGNRNFANNKIIFFCLSNKLHLLKWCSCKTLLTSQYVFASHGFKIPMCKGMKGQKYITLWHGCGYKDNADKQSSRFFDLALVPGPLFVETKSRFWNTTSNYLLAKGYPRYDWLLHPSDNAKEFADYYRKTAKKIIIWMPTYRNSMAYGGYAEDVITQFPLMANHDDWKHLDEVCRKNNVILLVKLHPAQRSYDIKFVEFSNIRQITNEDFLKADVQMYEFLAFTDGLISDYSSVAVDYLLVNKPIAFALDDFDIYNKMRGFVFDNPKIYMPGHHLYTVEDLCDYVTDVSVDNDKYADERKKMSNIAIYKSNNYCKEIVDSIGLG